MAVSYSEASPLIELPDGRRYHFGAQAYKYPPPAADRD